MSRVLVVALWKLRVLGLRAIRIAPRAAQLDEGLAVLAGLLVAAAQAFIDAYDAARTFEAQRGADMQEGRSALQTLYTRVRVWFSALQRDVPGFESARIEGSVEAPDLLLGDAQRMLEVVQAQGGSLPYAEELVSQLSEAMGRAETEWAEAREAVAKLQELRAVSRARAMELHKQLVGFRRALRAVVGSSHADYQNLRTSRSAADAEVEEELETETEVDTAVETEVTPPTRSNGHPVEAQPPATQ